MPTTYFNFHAQINLQTAQNLMAAVSHKLMAGTNDFYFLLSTPGGDVMSGLTIYNFLRALPVPITMHNIGNVDSIGNAIFVAANANQRFACAHSTFMFHGVGLDVADRHGIAGKSAPMAYNEKATRGASDRGAQVLQPARATVPP